MRLQEIMESDEEYRGQHQAPGKAEGAPLFNICLNDIYPDDFYGMNGFRYYADTGEATDQQSFSTVMAHHNRPNSQVKMYRAVPTDIEGVDIRKINPGDWVSVSRRYALEHGRNSLRNRYRIISKTVFARDLFTDGNSLSEWGYDPQPRDRTMDIERRRRMLLLATMSDEEKQAYKMERARHGRNTTPEEWNEIFKLATKDRPPSTSL